MIMWGKTSEYHSTPNLSYVPFDSAYSSFGHAIPLRPVQASGSSSIGDSWRDLGEAALPCTIVPTMWRERS